MTTVLGGCGGSRQDGAGWWEERGREGSSEHARDLAEQGVMSHAVARHCVGPLEAVAGEEHVPDESLDGSFPDQSDKEKLFYHR